MDGRHAPPRRRGLSWLYARVESARSAALATTDFVAATTFFATVCAWWFYRQRPSRRRRLITGILLGLALGAKLTGALLIPILFILAYVYPPPLPVVGCPVGIYLFQIGHGADSSPGRWTHVSEGHLAFFLGRMSSEGWLLYFPVALLIKTSLPIIILCLVALGVLVRDRARQIAAFLLLPVVAILGTAIVSRLNIGFRHILPALPFLMILGAMAAPALWHKRSPAALFAWLGDHERIDPPLTTWRISMNWSAIGRAISWETPIWIGGKTSTNWPIMPENISNRQESRLPIPTPAWPISLITGLKASRWSSSNQAGQTDFTPANPPAGRYAINAGDLQGPGLILGMLTESDLFDWFRHREPLTTLGGSIFIYDVAQQAEGTWIAHCLSPGPLLAEADAEQLVGRAGLRHIRFDCGSNWVFPENGASGWYVLPLDAPLWINDWLKEPVAEIVYRHQANAYGPDYAVVYWPGSSRGPLFADDVRRYPAAAAGAGDTMGLRRARSGMDHGVADGRSDGRAVVDSGPPHLR